MVNFPDQKGEKRSSSEDRAQEKGPFKGQEKVR